MSVYIRRSPRADMCALTVTPRNGQAKERKEGGKEMPKGSITHDGICKFCGQSQIVDAIDKESADHMATMNCKCEEGQAFRRVESAKNVIETKFDGFSEETVDLLKNIVTAVNYEIIASANIKLNGSVKVSVSLTSKDKISVTRTDVAVDKEEI